MVASRLYQDKDWPASAVTGQYCTTEQDKDGGHVECGCLGCRAGPAQTGRPGEVVTGDRALLAWCHVTALRTGPWPMVIPGRPAGDAVSRPHHELGRTARLMELSDVGRIIHSSQFTSRSP